MVCRWLRTSPIWHCNQRSSNIFKIGFMVHITNSFYIFWGRGQKIQNISYGLQRKPLLQGCLYLYNDCICCVYDNKCFRSPILPRRSSQINLLISSFDGRFLYLPKWLPKVCRWQHKVWIAFMILESKVQTYLKSFLSLVMRTPFPFWWRIF